MAEEPQVLVRGFHWREAFGFTHIFRAFRVAIHPSKLVLALLALLSLYVGGRLLDTLWFSEHLAVRGEVGIYRASDGSGEFIEARKQRRDLVARAYAPLIQETAQTKKGQSGWADKETADKSYEAALRGDDTSHVNHMIAERRNRAVEEIEKAYVKRIEEIDKSSQESAKKEEEKAKTARERVQYIRGEYERADADFDKVNAARGRGLFRAFFEYQTARIKDVADGVLAWRWLGPGGVVAATFDFFTTAPSWAIRHHPFYFVLFGTLFLVVWSLFGGAIARIAAVHVADEGRKLSVRQGLSFAVSKFLSFLSAPLIPALIILVLGLVLAVGGLLLYIPWLGEIVVSALYFLALAAGFVMTLVLLGTAGGFNLMYPTIAVEGSDSFDAISRSFSYLYAKPWRMLFYSAVALAYGAICYLFVRLFIFLMLLLTWFFVGLFVTRKAANADYLWNTLLPRPNADGSLSYDVNYQALSPTQDFSAFLLSFWVYLTIAMLGAFAISFYFSASTIIYFLMRREVDATEMDDVYLEQPEEDFTEAPVAPAASPATSTGAPAIVVEPPPTTPPGDSERPA